MKPIKPNKKTWIYGVGARTARKPHFPPVVPWITPALRDDLVEFILNSIAQDDGGIETEIARLEAQPTLTTVEQRRLHMLKKERDERPRRDGLPLKVANHVANFSLLRGVRSVRIEYHAKHTVRDQTPSHHIVLETCPIVINGVILGTYDAFLDPAYDLPKSAFDLVRRDHTYPTGVHPHWSTGGPCFGTFGPMLQQVLRKHDVAAALGMFMNYLAIYDAYSPLIRIGSFRRSSYENKNPLA